MNLQMIQGILAQQSQAGRPSQPICASIASLKDLCELSGKKVDWRRGGGGGGETTPQARGNGQTGRPVFRSLSSTSLPSSSSTGSLVHKSPSNRTLSGSGSPVVTGPAPYSPMPSSGAYSPMRYQSKFKNSSQPVEDKILNNIILSKLNKFSGSTYADVRDFLYQILGSGEPDLGEMVRQFMLMVFKKAASEEVYCSLYAKLLAEISTRYKVILEEMQKLQANYLEIFDEIEEVPEGGENYEAFVEKNKEKRYRQGYSQFLAELAALEILDLSNLEQTVRKLMDLMVKYASIAEKKSLVEEYADCLVRMSRVLKKKSSPFFTTAKNSLTVITKSSIERMLTNKEQFPSLSPKARFILMDVRDNLA